MSAVEEIQDQPLADEWPAPCRRRRRRAKLALIAVLAFPAGAATHRAVTATLAWHERRSTTAAIGRILEDAVRADDGLHAWVGAMAKWPEDPNATWTRLGADWADRWDIPPPPSSVRRLLALSPQSTLNVARQPAYPGNDFVEFTLYGRRRNFRIVFWQRYYENDPPGLDKFRMPEAGKEHHHFVVPDVMVENSY